MNGELRVQLGAHPVAYPLVRGLARLGSVVRVPRVGIVVSDAALARAVLTDTASFAKTGPGSPAALWTPVVGPSVLLNMEGEAHAELRRALADLFTPSAVAALCARVAGDDCAALRDRLAAGEPVDMVPVAQRLAGAVIAGLVGLVGLDARAAAGPAFAAATAAFALTGTETVASFVPRLVALLADHGMLAAVAAHRGRVDTVVAEALRVTVPSPVMLRRVVTATRIGRVPVREGLRVVIATVSAARAAGGFDPDRPHPPELRRLWFGAGPHFCLGMPLAMAQVWLVLDAVLDAQLARPLRVARRRVARRVLIPAFRELVVQGA